MTKEQRYTVEVRNAFGMLADHEHTDITTEDIDSDGNSQDRDASAAAPKPPAPTRVRMPPIVGRPDAINIYTYCREDHKLIFADLKLGQIPAFSHPLRKDKNHIYVLKDLPRGLPFEEVTAGVEQVVPAVKVYPLNKRRMEFEEDPFPYYSIHLPADYDTRKLLSIRTILNFRVRWDKLNTANRSTQCHRCQQFGHGSDLCSHKPHCVKCIGEHLTSECPRVDNGGDNAQCLNCKGAHTASFRSCPAHHAYLDKMNKIKASRRRPTSNTDRQPNRNTINNSVRNVQVPARTIERPPPVLAGRSYAQAATGQSRAIVPPKHSAASSRPPPPNSSTGGDRMTLFTSHTAELNQLNSVCDLSLVLEMVREINLHFSGNGSTHKTSAYHEHKQQVYLWEVETVLNLHCKYYIGTLMGSSHANYYFRHTSNPTRLISYASTSLERQAPIAVFQIMTYTTKTGSTHASVASPCSFVKGSDIAGSRSIRYSSPLSFVSKTARQSRRATVRLLL